MSTYYRAILGLSLFLALGACNKSYQQGFGRTEDLKKYGLVFRLQDYRQRIDYFEKKGLADQAKAEEVKIRDYNLELVKSFRQEFNFCPVRFYYSSQQEALLAGKPVLLNDQLQPDASIPLPEKVIAACYAPGEIVENQFESAAFRIVGSTFYIRPTFGTWLLKKPLQTQDVRKVNRILHKLNGTKQKSR